MVVVVVCDGWMDGWMVIMISSVRGFVRDGAAVFDAGTFQLGTLLLAIHGSIASFVASLVVVHDLI